jgi:polar amino acid transport system substrate-binding protein/two-component system sensor histidine kinase EvgS
MQKKMRKKEIKRFLIFASGVFISIFFLILALTEEDHKKPAFTKIEKEWINSNPNVRIVPTPNFPPIDFIDLKKSMHHGVASDYLKEISKITGLKFTYIFTLTWQEALDAIKNKEAEIISSVQKTKERQEFLNFTSPYIKVQNVLVVNSEINNNLSLNEMKNKKLGIIRGYAVEGFIRKNYPDIKIEYSDNILESIFFLSMGKVDAVITNIPVLLYFKSKNMVGNLKISEVLDFEYDLSFGVNKDHEILHSILDKALSSISDRKKEEIQNQWISFKYQRFFEDKLFVSIFVLSLVLFFLMFFLILSWRKKAIELSKAKKEAEDAMKKAHEADAAKSKFLANVSHEIRTPMNSVLGFAEILNSENLGSKAKTYVANIKNSGKTLLKLIDDILDMSKIEAGRFEMYYHPCDLGNIFDIVRSEFKLAAEEKNLELNIFADSSLPKYLLLDELRLKQIIVNLISNSLKFTKKGFINLFAYPLFKNGNFKKIDIVIEVKDSGIGILLEQQEKIFEPFTQQNGQDSREYGGTGLGLSIAKKFAEMMNGEITLDSKAGFGSTFKILLRDVLIAENCDNKNYKTTKCFSSIKFLKKTEILMADHETSDKEYVSYILKPFGIKLFQVSDSAEAINFVSKRLPDIILLNMNLKDKKSMNLIEYMEKNQLLKKVMIIAVSGDEKLMRSKGISGFLEKPFTRDSIISELIKFIPYSRDLDFENFHEKAAKDYFDKEDINKIILSHEYSFKNFCETFDFIIMNKWIEIQNNFIFSDVCEFAEELIEAGKKFGAYSFVLYGKDIKAFADDFDIDSFKNVIRLYPGLVSEIKKHLERDND